MMLLMKKRSCHRKNISRHHIERITVLFVLMFLVGTLVSAVIFSSMETGWGEYAEQIANSYIKLRQTQTEKEIFLSIFIPNAALIVFMFILRGNMFLFPAVFVFQGLGFGLNAVNLLKTAENSPVKVLTFTAFQEKFWPVLVLFAIGTAMIRNSGTKDFHSFNTFSVKSRDVGYMILSILLMGIACSISAFVVAGVGRSLLIGL